MVLKVLALTHRALLYCPFLEVKHLLSLFRNVSTNWREIETQQIKEPTDRARCLFFSKLIQAYADVLHEKASLVAQFSLIVDSCYCLQAGISHQGASPLGDEFMSKLLRLWTQFGQLKSKIFQKPPFLWAVHLSIGTTVLEDQYLLFSLLSFLNLTFKVVYKTYTLRSTQGPASQQSKTKVMDFLKAFDSTFEREAQEFGTMVQFVRELPEY